MIGYDVAAAAGGRSIGEHVTRLQGRAEVGFVLNTADAAPVACGRCFSTTFVDSLITIRFYW